MRRNTIGILLITMATVWCSAEPVPAGGGAERRGPWTQALYATDGRLLSAIGTEEHGAPITLSTERGSLDGRPLLRTIYRRGADVLEIEKIYESDYGVDLVYSAGGERLVVSLTLDDLTGETLVVYRMPDGEVFSLWISADGELLSGDVDGLRRALKRPMEITRLMRSYLDHRKPFESQLPSSAEAFIMPVMYLSCEDACAMGCGPQCAWECAAFGAVGCRICQTACAIGCAIGCSS